MTVAFFCPRLSHLRQFGPLAAEARRRGGRALFLLPVGAEFPASPKDDATPGCLLPYGGVEAVESDAALLDVCRRRKVRVIFHLGLRWPDAIAVVRAELRVYDRVAFVSVGFHEEEFIHLLEDGIRRLREWDAVTTWDQAALDAAAGIYAPLAAIRHDISALGDPLADQPGMPGFGGFRGRIGMPAGQKLVLYLPAANAHLLRPAWVGRWYRRAPWNLPWAPWGDQVPSQRRVAALVRRFCDRHGAAMVVKDRTKSPCPGWLRRMADAVVGDASFCPSTLLEAMAAADLAVGLAGGWAVEALTTGTPALSILPYPQAVYEHSLLLPIRQRLYRERWRWCLEAFTRDGWGQLEAWSDEAPYPLGGKCSVPDAFQPGASARIMDLVDALVAAPR